MLAKKSGQIDIFNSMIFDKLIPKDHLLVKICEVVDFTYLYDTVQYYTTLSDFRATRLGNEVFNKIFTGIVSQCIEKDLVNTNRYMIDSTDVAANVNYPTDKNMKSPKK